MDGTSIGRRIELRRKDLNLSQGDVARKVGVAVSTIQRYEKGKIASVRLPTVEAIAKALMVTPDWLIGKSDDMTGEKQAILPLGASPSFPTKNVPRLGTIACGNPTLAEQNIECYDSIPEFIACDFTLQCKGDSMINARIFDGDIVCIREQSEVESGEIAAVIIDQEEATLKRVRYFDDRIILEPENPIYKSLSFYGEEMNRIKILGKATYFISTVR